MPHLPGGTVTFLFTDIEGSTRLLRDLRPDRYAGLLAEYQRLLRSAFTEGGGYEVDTQGDAFFVAFPRAAGAVVTAISAQRAIAGQPWPDDLTVRVRMGLHTGEPLSAETGYVGVDVHRAARICAAANGGQVLLSQTTRDLVGDDLPQGTTLRDLGEHRLKDLARPEHLFQLVIPHLPAVFPPLRSLNAFPNNLPLQLSSFIGRERALAEVRRFLDTARLLTLTGPGGVGKTRLGIQAAAEVLEEFTDGVWLVELAALRDPVLVPQAVASTLGVHEERGQMMVATLADYLHRRQLLLMLDNCEHLLLACAELAEALLRTCPRVHILATSREALGIQGEIIFPVPSLSLADAHRLLPLESLGKVEAIRLFIERAVAGLPTFTMTVENAAAVAEVCRRLDGIPLAIELAAARVKVLTADQIAARLDDRFRLLAQGSRTALPRQQTLQATMDWSHDLLSEGERVVLRRLSVFAGGLSLDGAEAVCAGEGIEVGKILDLLSRLVDKSLVIAEGQNGGVRYRLLETVRQYAHTKLVESGEARSIRRRHRDWHLALAEEAEPEMQGPDQKVWLDRLEREHDNLRAAMARSLEDGETEAAVRMAGALWLFWYVRGYFSEGLAWLDAALSESGDASSSARAKALYGAGTLAGTQGNYTRAAALYEESLTLRRQLGNSRDIVSSLLFLGHVYWTQGDYGKALPLYEESLALSRELGDKRSIASSLRNLGLLARRQGKYAQATALFEESLALFQDLGGKRDVGYALNNLGLLALYQEAGARAVALLEEGLAIFRELKDKGGIALLLTNLGLAVACHGDHGRAAGLCAEGLTLFQELQDKSGTAYALYSSGRVAYREGDLAQAAARYRDALTLRREVGDKRGIAECLEGLAAVGSARGQPERAARLSGATATLREAIGAPLPPADRAEYERAIAAARMASGEEAFAAALTCGRTMTLDQAIEDALAIASG